MNAKPFSSKVFNVKRYPENTYRDGEYQIEEADEFPLSNFEKPRLKRDLIKFVEKYRETLKTINNPHINKKLRNRRTNLIHIYFILLLNFKISNYLCLQLNI